MNEAVVNIHYCTKGLWLIDCWEFWWKAAESWQTTKTRHSVLWENFWCIFQESLSKDLTQFWKKQKKELQKTQKTLSFFGANQMLNKSESLLLLIMKMNRHLLHGACTSQNNILNINNSPSLVFSLIRVCKLRVQTHIENNKLN